jgi:ribonuclease BN (tRNA processing enzyme)
MKVRFLGSGDAFGSGGRLNTCFHVTPGPESGAGAFLIDCGATALPALKAAGIDRNAIDTILITHFHADHFGGVPFFILDAQFFAKRTAPLTIAGPEGLRDWYVRALETAFPGSSSTRQKFGLSLVELEAGRRQAVGDLTVTPQRVIHGPPGGPFFAYRIEVGGRVLAYTGDTEWTEALVEVGRDVDLLIAEAYFRDKAVPFHLDLASLERNLDRIRPKRLVLTHMSDDMLRQADAVPYETARDGLEIAVA